MHGNRNPRADVVLWETAEKKAADATPVLVVECKAEQVDIQPRDCYQGESSILRVRVDCSTVLPEFVMAVINSSSGQAYFRSKAKRTTKLASINSREVSGLPLPLPPLPGQETLVNELERRRSKAGQLLAYAAAVRQAAWTAFETALFES